MSVAKTYARSLFEAAKAGFANGASERRAADVEAELRAFLQGASAERHVEMFTLGRLTSARDKQKLLKELFTKITLSDVVQNFLLLLARKDRMRHLPEVLDAFSEVRLEAEGGIRGHVISAEPMSESDLQSLSQAFGKKLGKKVAFQVREDASLLAGVRVVVNGVTYDGSLRSQLDRLRDRLVSAG